MHRSFVSAALAAALAALMAACGGGGMATGPTGMPGSGTTMLMSVAPQGGATGVPATMSAVLRFSGPMASGMEPFVELHQGGLDGAVVPMSCSFASDRGTMTCSTASPLRPGTRYTLHVGAGMRDANGRPIDMGQSGGTMGGQWIMGGMMGPSHGGSPWGMMSGNWQGTNGSYGMAFEFTTA